MIDDQEIRADGGDWVSNGRDLAFDYQIIEGYAVRAD